MNCRLLHFWAFLSYFMWPVPFHRHPANSFCYWPNNHLQQMPDPWTGLYLSAREPSFLKFDDGNESENAAKRTVFMKMLQQNFELHSENSVTEVWSAVSLLSWKLRVLDFWPVWRAHHTDKYIWMVMELDIVIMSCIFCRMYLSQPIWVDESITNFAMSVIFYFSCLFAHSLTSFFAIAASASSSHKRV